MERASKILGWAICALFWTVSLARGQPIAGVAKAKEYIDQEVQRHRWELNVNLESVFGIERSDSHHYHYMFKRNANIKRIGRGRAWRFSLSPGFANGKQHHPDTTAFGTLYLTDYLIAPQIVLGHEWQRIHGRTMLFGGVDFVGKLSWIRSTAYNVTSPWDNKVIGMLIYQHHQSMAWLSTFLGAKFYLNHRISLSVESQIQYGVITDNVRTWFENQPIAKDLNTYRDIHAAPAYLFSLSYNLK